MNMSGAKIKMLLMPTDCTSTGVTGSYVDLQGFVTGNRSIKAILLCGPGSVVGTAGGRVQTADDTSSTNVTTKATFATLATIGGSAEAHFNPGNQRYVRFCSDTQAGKDAWLACVLVAESRYVP